MVLTDTGNVLFGNQQIYYQLAFLLRKKAEVIKKGYLITLFTQHPFIMATAEQQKS